MISRIKGKIKKKKENSILLDVNDICYEILIPTAIMESIKIPDSEEDLMELVIYHYHQIEPSRSVPVMIGFENEIEREFFGQFIGVSGIGPKAAVRALSLPISIIAEAIDSGNHSLLQTLPGIGKQRAREIIAKLQGKVGKFGLIRDGARVNIRKTPDEDVQKEALEVLLQLQYKKQIAERMLQQAFSNNPDLKTVEDILNEIYRQRSKDKKEEEIKSE